MNFDKLLRWFLSLVALYPRPRAVVGLTRISGTLCVVGWTRGHIPVDVYAEWTSPLDVRRIQGATASKQKKSALKLLYVWQTSVGRWMLRWTSCRFSYGNCNTLTKRLSWSWHEKGIYEIFCLIPDHSMTSSVYSNFALPSLIFYASRTRYSGHPIATGRSVGTTVQTKFFRLLFKLYYSALCADKVK